MTEYMYLEKYTTRTDAIEQKSHGWGVSIEIGEAILDFAGWNEALADRIWESPTPGEDEKILADAWELADADEEYLIFGERIYRNDIPNKRT